MNKLMMLAMGTVIAATSAWTAAATVQPLVFQEAYAVYLLQHPDSKEQNSKTLIQQFTQDYAELFKNHKKVNQEQFIQFEQKQLDGLMKQRREMSLKQAHVRYGILDADKNQKLTLKEFQDIGLKNFSDYDKNSDGIVTSEDVKLTTTTHDGFRMRLPISMPIANNPEEFIRQYGQGKAYATLGDFLSGRDKQFFETDSNQDLTVSEKEYVDEFMGRYDKNTLTGKEKMKDISARKFQAISGGKSTIQAKDIEKFAQQVDQAISQ